MRSIRLTPISAEIIIISIAVYVGCTFQSSTNRQPFAVVQRAWHAILSQDLSEPIDGIRRAKELELHGPLDVWNGEWWRIPVTVFHHADIVSLVLNAGAIWYLGSRLEQRWGGLAMTMFVGPAICLPVMLELSLGQAYMGLSGLVCAMLGALVVLRQYDEVVARDFSEDAGEIGVAIIVVGWLATLSNIISLPNAAHFAGFTYGALMAGITSGPLRKVSFLRVTIMLLHLWLAPALFLVCHPFWIGRYHWYEALTTRNTQRAERSLEHALACDRSLVGAWLQWSHLYEQRGDQLEAWRKLIDGLAVNPAAPSLIDSTRRLWRQLDLRQSREAEMYLEDVFGRRAATEWLAQIRSGPAIPPENRNDVTIEDQVEDISQFSLEQKVELPPIDNLVQPFIPQNRKDQIDENEAVEGQTL